MTELPALPSAYIHSPKKRVLFVCLGNICRSPAAEEVTRHILKERGLDNRFVLDSAGLYGGHAGELPDSRMRAHASRRGYTLTHRSRPIRRSDFSDFDLIVGMDASNLSRLRAFAATPEEEAKIVSMADFCRQHPGWDHIPDPYYEGAQGFELVLDLLEDACNGLVDASI
ncbi:MAG: low molecular weight phosphotyrosine protein phosphatase [Muribaculaceae bacterium]|nr:low molecular weight phosphotyrosine protein phosphatase [Muribaculaceae bacterium]